MSEWKGKGPASTSAVTASRNQSYRSSTPPTPGTPGTEGLSIVDTERDDQGIPLHLSDAPPTYEAEESAAAGPRASKRMSVVPGPGMSSLTTSGPGLDSKAAIDDEGKIDVSFKLKKALPDLPKDYAKPVIEYAVDKANSHACPPLNIVIFIVGSRGDVQPYIALALELIRRNGHRVRIATHGEFREFVLDANAALKGQRGPQGQSLEGRLEFFDAGGDPKELMAYMVKNPGLMPGFSSLTNGDIGSKRKMTAQLLKGFFESTFYPDGRNGAFAVDAIISNPPAFAHIHIAEALGIPLHMSFTMPWSPTTDFHHPLVNIKESNAEKGLTNYLSFAMSDMLVWQGLGDLINKFRSQTLGLDKLTLRQGPSLLDTLKVPWTYCWSSGLIPQPKDWKQHIDISGFYFLEGTSGFQLPADLVEFLEAGPPPIFIGFGSVPVKNPKAMTDTLLEAVSKAGVRALISAGWGGLGDDQPSKDVYIIEGSVPHDWLFADGRVAAVCHHGGAGTTAIGLKNGLPTIVVPFFGDQQFWGDMIAAAGAGPAPIPPKTLTAERLAEGIAFAMSAPAQDAAQKMGIQIRMEGGLERGVASFHSHLPLLNMRCQVDPARIAHWWSDAYCLRISGAVAGVLQQEGILQFEDLKAHRAREYESARHHTDPWNGGVQSVFNLVTTSVQGVTELFFRPVSGAINLTWGVPLAMCGVINDLYEGIDNLPALLGSDTRQKGKVTGWKSGFREAGLGMAYGLLDGVTGLVTEPIVGAKQEGAVGVAKGVGRSLVNLGVRPTAGALGFFALPLRGMYRSAQRKIHRAPDKVLFAPRAELSRIEIQTLTPQERAEIIDSFRLLERDTKKRKDALRKKMKRWLLTGEMVDIPGSQPGTPPNELEKTTVPRMVPPPPLPPKGARYLPHTTKPALPARTWSGSSRTASEPPEYGYSDTKSQLVGELERSGSVRRSTKERYLEDLDSQYGGDGATLVSSTQDSETSTVSDFDVDAQRRALQMYREQRPLDRGDQKEV